MHKIQSRDVTELSLAMDAINRKFDFWTTVRVLVLSEMQRRRHAWELSLLDNRTRQDIGLPEIEIEPQVLWLHRWDGRL